VIVQPYDGSVSVRVVSTASAIAGPPIAVMTLAWSTRFVDPRADRQDDAISRAVLSSPASPSSRCLTRCPHRWRLLDDTGLGAGHRAAAEQHGRSRTMPMTPPSSGAHHLVIAFISTGRSSAAPSRR